MYNLQVCAHASSPRLLSIRRRYYARKKAKVGPGHATFAAAPRWRHDRPQLRASLPAWLLTTPPRPRAHLSAACTAPNAQMPRTRPHVCSSRAAP